MAADLIVRCGAGFFQAILLRAPTMRVEGGSDEILRNEIAEPVFGMPGDIRVDKNIPGTQMPTS